MSNLATEITLHDPLLFRQACYIDGTWVGALDGAVIDVDDPATSEVMGKVPRMGTAQTRQAIDAAAHALPAWRKRTAKERSNVLRRWFDLMMANQEDLARLMTLEQGKPLTESRGEVAYAAAFLEWFGEEAKRVYGDTIPAHQADKRIVVVKEPVGVVACITPWNFPLAMITRKAGPALAAGCTVVLKPASQTPFSALALAELAERAGVPKGVFNVITGKASEIGAEVLMKATKVDGVYESDPAKNPLATRYDRISFTEVLTRDLKVMDATAISLAREQKMRIIIFNLKVNGNIRKAVLGEQIGTLLEDACYA